MLRKLIVISLLSGPFLFASSLFAFSLFAFSGESLSFENQSTTPKTPDLLKDINFSAQKVEYDSEKGLIIATGDVTLFQEDNVLKADRVTFNNKTREVRATGNITIRDDSGNILFMDESILQGGLKNAFIRNVRILFSDDAHLVAREGTRVGELTVLNKAAYSPCKTCNEDGQRKPLWQIRADKITHDANNKVIKYKNVLLEIAGVPILYTPYFSHPDPTVRSASGFLVPEFGTSSELGINVTVPYYFNLAPDKDLTIEPLITSNEGVVLGGTYRQHTGNGQFYVAGSTTNALDRDITEIGKDNREIRGHLFSEGKFDLDNLKMIGDQWQWDYALRWVSDDTYLRRYYQDRSDVLKSHAKIENFTSRSYFTAGVFGCDS